MTNVNEEDIDLRLALGSRSHSAGKRLNNTRLGAGANAISRVDIPFAASDPLSELVWSPNNGLSLRSANSGLPDSRAILTWNLGESANEISPSMSVRSKGSEDIKASDVVEATMLDGGTSSAACQRSCDDGKMEEAGTTDAIEEELCKGSAEEDLFSSRNVQIAESSKRNDEQDTLAEGAHDRKSDLAINRKFPSLRGTRFIQKERLETHASRTDIMGLAIPESHATKVSEPLGCSLPNLQVQQEPGEEVTSASGNVRKETRAPISIPPHTLMRLESFDENDLGHLAAKESFATENSRDAGRETGKERASSDGNMSPRSPIGEDDSHESVESCNSAGLISKGIKRLRYDQGQLEGTKRVRNQIEGNHGPISSVKPDSSFMNWISNMVKGSSGSNKEDPSPLPLTFAPSGNVFSNNHQENLMCNKTTDSTRPIMGFQTVFRSLYCRSTKASDTRVHKENQSLEESRELMVANNGSLGNLPPVNSCKQIVLSDKEVNPHISGNSRGNGEVSPSDSLCEKAISNADKTSMDIPLPMSCIPGKTSPFSSLWITRLYTRTSRLENSNQITEKPFDCSSDSPNTNFETRENDVLSSDQKIPKADSVGDEVRALEQELQSFSPKLTPIQSSEKLTSSEAMASIFAKRLDAIRHIIYPSEKRKSPSCQLICFFCGRSGHDLRTCPELTETELENLLAKLSSFDRVEESPCLCIRCFQLDHWAISCPLVSSDDRKQVVSRQVASSKKPILASFPSFFTWDVNGSSRKILSSSNEFQKSTSSSSAHHLKDTQIFPRYDFVNSHHAVRQEEVFQAIRKLRLSRADILRWMSSNFSLSHLNGFFLRFRLGKVEEGLGGASYYVACITENVDCKSMKSILVDAGGIKSSVGSQYISNHEFLEDEIKAWWSRTVKTGSKVPSLDELNSKLEKRKRLGF